MSATKKNMLCAFLVAVSVVLGYVEFLIPPVIPVYGLKIGFSIFPLLYAFFELSPKRALIIGIIKAILNSILFSGLMSFAYSFTGIIFTVVGMYTLYSLSRSFSEIGISVLGSALFQAGQVLTASLILKSIAPLLYLPYLLLGSIACGIFSGTVIKILRTRVSLKK
ncbi:MAG: Gx transporter family protein [Clostridia bacterium]|nr:Gx transporter family protein [Clostridia bacterium]